MVPDAEMWTRVTGGKQGISIWPSVAEKRLEMLSKHEKYFKLLKTIFDLCLVRDPLMRTSVKNLVSRVSVLLDEVKSTYYSFNNTSY